MCEQDRFPVRLFALFVLSYAGQAVYTTYLNLYLSDAGLTETQIGVTVSLSTACVLAAELFWGRVSDRAAVKNGVLKLLFTASALLSLGFYLHNSFGFLAAAVTILACFLNPISPLQDNLALESLEASRWDYAPVRMGGTIGYCLAVLLTGFFLQDNYRPIFWMTSLCMMGCRLLCAALPPVRGARSPVGLSAYGELLRNRSLVGLFLFSLSLLSGSVFTTTFIRSTIPLPLSAATALWSA